MLFRKTLRENPTQRDRLQEALEVLTATPPRFPNIRNSSLLPPDCFQLLKDRQEMSS
jgi:hypothetical protein